MRNGIRAALASSSPSSEDLRGNCGSEAVGSGLHDERHRQRGAVGNGHGLVEKQQVSQCEAVFQNDRIVEICGRGRTRCFFTRQRLPDCGYSEREKTIGLFLMMLVMVAGVEAANPPESRQRMAREQLAETQAKHIAEALAFDEQTAAKFVETYCECQKEIWTLAPKKQRQRGATETEAEETIQNRFDRSQKLLDIRKKYYDEYSKFLTQKQIERVYELEKQMMKRLSDRHDRGRRGRK